MTRWVRCGSSQKHKKMPGDATKWGEFDNQHAREISPKKKKNIQCETEINKKAKALPSTSLFNKAEESLDEDFFEQDKYCLTENSDEISNKQEDSTFDESHSHVSSSKNKEDLLTNKMRGSKKKKKRNNFDGNNDEIDSNEVTVSHKKMKLENDCSTVTQNDKVLEQANNHSDFAESNQIPEESFSQKQDKKKRKKNKKEKRYNQVDSECFSENDGTTETYFQDSNESHSIKQKTECVTSSDKEIEPVQSLQDINGSAKKKKVKLENDCSTVTQNNKVLEQANNHSDFAESNQIPEESFSQKQDKKKRKKNKKEKRYNEVDSECFSENDGTTETYFQDSNESHSIKQETECVTSSDKEIEPIQSLQDINGSAKKKKGKKNSNMNSDSDQSSMNNESCKNSLSKVLENKKEIRLKKLKKKREELGLIQLPHNVENKLRKIKKRLMEKGFPPEKLKEILRQERRKEELQYRKVYNPHKLCFGCREPGHVLADCPKKSESQTGICFKCGSVEHTSYKCPEKIQGFPYAKCFICKEQGHISRNCPQNKHGVYPKGGRCNLCGNVNHLKKDCPTLKKKENEEEEITLPTLNEDVSIDAEVVKKEEIKRKSHKKSKVVKF